MKNFWNNNKGKRWFVIVWLIVFFPVGLYLMFRHSEWGKIPKIGVSAFFALFLFAGFAGDPPEESVADDDTEEDEMVAEEDEAAEEATTDDAEEPKEEEDPEESANEEENAEESTEESTDESNEEESSKSTESTEEDEPEEESTEETQEEESIEDTVTESAEEEVDNIIRSSDEIEEIGYIEEGEQLFIRINTGTGWSTDSMKNSMRVQTHDILRDVNDIDDVSTVNIGFRLPLQDQYGEESVEDVMNLVFYEETINKINFDNVLQDNMPDIADEYWNHPALDE